jgi:hypothetical protein
MESYLAFCVSDVLRLKRVVCQLSVDGELCKVLQVFAWNAAVLIKRIISRACPKVLKYYLSRNSEIPQHPSLGYGIPRVEFIHKIHTQPTRQ